MIVLRLGHKGLREPCYESQTDLVKCGRAEMKFAVGLVGQGLGLSLDWVLLAG